MERFFQGKAVIGLLIMAFLTNSFLPRELKAQGPPPQSKAGACGDIWLVHQDFFSIGKRDVYEALWKVWLEQLTQLSATREVPPIITMQAKGTPEYIALIPLGNFAALDGFYALNEALKNQAGQELWTKQQEALSSTLNFQVLSLHQFLPACSCLPGESNISIMNRPFVQYFVYSIEPGQGKQFEQFLQRKAKEHLDKKTQTCWRVWKVLFGGDVPKYILTIFSQREESLSEDIKKMDIIDSSMEKILRREKEGKAILRRDLSFVMEKRDGS